MVAGAIGLARPERFGTLTLVGDDWQQVRARMFRLAYDIRQSRRHLQWCWHVEANPAGTGHHVHFWQRGQWIAQAALVSMARRRGMGEVVDIRRWKAKGGAAVTYGVKLAGINYGVKDVERDDTMPRYLADNGGRLVHASRGWWLRRDGTACGQRAAMKEAARVGGGGAELTWSRLRRVDVARAREWAIVSGRVRSGEVARRTRPNDWERVRRGGL